MNRFFRILIAVVALCVLSAYFFNDLVLTGPPEMMTWDEFSSNPGAVARFRERAAFGGETLSAEDTRRAYERYVSTVNQKSAHAAGITSASSEHIDGFKMYWRSVYRSFVPAKFSGKKASRAVLSDESRQRIGIIFTLLAVVVCVGVLSLFIKLCDRRARV